MLAEVMKVSRNEGRPFSILFKGCSFLIVYEAGVLAAFQKLSPDILKSASRIYGASSGSIIATLGLCECDAGKGYALPFTLSEEIEYLRYFGVARDLFFSHS